MAYTTFISGVLSFTELPVLKACSILGILPHLILTASLLGRCYYPSFRKGEPWLREAKQFT